MGLGFVLATVSVYIVEIATNDMRGLLGCFVQFQVKSYILKSPRKTNLFRKQSKTLQFSEMKD
jgi:hypothetical protein